MTLARARFLIVAVGLLVLLPFTAVPAHAAQQKDDVVADARNDLRYTGNCPGSTRPKAHDINQVATTLKRSDAKRPWKTSVNIFVNNVIRPTKARPFNSAYTVSVYFEGRYHGYVSVFQHYTRGSVRKEITSGLESDPDGQPSGYSNRTATFGAHNVVVGFDLPSRGVVRLDVTTEFSKPTGAGKTCRSFDKLYASFGSTPV